MISNATRFVTLLCFFLGAHVQLHAQASKDPFLQKLAGEWSAKGTASGMVADISMKWEPALADKFMRLTYRMDMQGKDGKVYVFEGTALYKVFGENQYKATWFDSTGDMHPITSSSDATMLTSNWGTPETKLGKTTYQLTAEGKVEIVDYIQKKDGTWKEFNRNTVVKVTM